MSLNPRETLDTMLGLLGFVCEIKEFQHERISALMADIAEKVVRQCREASGA